MAKVNQANLKQWQDGEVMHGVDYNKERDLLVAAYNDSQDQIDALKGPGSIGTAQIVDGSVTNPKLATSAVTSNKLAENAVTTFHINDGAVSESKLATRAVTNAKIDDAAVTSIKLAGGAVTSAKIADLNVTDTKIAGSAVTRDKIAPGAVTEDRISDAAVSTIKIAPAAVTTSRLADGAVTSDKLADNSVTPSKVPEASVTQYAYTKAQTDQQITNALSGGLPQEVVDQIIEQVADIGSGTVNVLPDDSIRPDTAVSSMPPGITVFKVTADKQAWIDSTFSGSEGVTPVFVRITSTSASAVQELFYVNTSGGWMSTYTRSALNGGGWTSWRDVESSYNAQVKADKALADAKLYTESYSEEVTIPAVNANIATNYRMPSEIVNANIVQNSSALLGLDGWRDWGNINGWRWDVNPTVGAFFYVNQVVPSGQYALLQSSDIAVTPNSTLHLQAMFHTAGSYANSIVYVDILDVTNNAYVTQLNANLQQWWHRKTMTFKVPASCNVIAVRLIVTNVPAGATMGFSRIKVAETSKDTPYTNEADTRLLKQSVSNGKASVAAAITDMKVPTAADAPYETMATNIRSIPQGHYQSVGDGATISAIIPGGARSAIIGGTLATFPAGTKVINIRPTSSTSIPWIQLNEPVAANSTTAQFALRDSQGNIVSLSGGLSAIAQGNTSGGLSILSSTIDLSIGSIYTMCASGTAASTPTSPSATISWQIYQPTIPAGFQKDGVLTLVVICNNYNTSNSGIGIYPAWRITSM